MAPRLALLRTPAPPRATSTARTRAHRVREQAGRAPMVRTTPIFNALVEALIVTGALTEAEALDHAKVELAATRILDLVAAHPDQWLEFLKRVRPR